jgi:hypothetical protein
MMPLAQTIAVAIERPWREVYEAIWPPQAFCRWASGLSQVALVADGDYWCGQGPDGPLRIRFTAHNAFGVMDHYVDLGNGEEIYVPLRVIANGSGAEVQLTLFRQPGMSDEQYAADAAWVQRDLLALRALFEA